MADYGYFKDSKGNKKYINDDSIYHEGKNLRDVINSKANSSDVYNKTEIDENLLPMTMLKGLYIGDSFTVTTDIETNKQYIFINSHIFNREVVIITIFESTIITDRLINTGSTDLSSFTLNGDKLTIKGAGRCRGRLYKLSYQQAG